VTIALDGGENLYKKNSYGIFAYDDLLRKLRFTAVWCITAQSVDEMFAG